MNTATLKHGDTIQVNVRGRLFEATFLARDGDGVLIAPPPTCTYHHVKAHEVRKRLTRYDPRQSQARGPE